MAQSLTERPGHGRQDVELPLVSWATVMEAPHTYYLVSSSVHGARGPAQERAVRDLLLTFRADRP